MKILALTRYSRLGASSRLRTMQYLPSWEAAGFKVELAPFFDDAYLTDLYAGQRRSRGLRSYFATRIAKIRNAQRPDLIWIEKEALPWVPWAIEHALLPQGIPIVSDYDDAVFHRYDLNQNRLIRWILRDKIDRVMKASTLVTAGNEYLADRARAAGAAWVEVVPTVVNTDVYTTKPAPEPDGLLRVGWIGTPYTWKALAQPVAQVLGPVLERHNALFRAVGAGLENTRKGRLEVLPWAEVNEVDLIRSIDIGVMPLPDTPWTQGKCGYKLIQYMACGVPVIAAPVGVNTSIVKDGETGYLASSDSEWQKACEELLSNPHQRQSMGAAGRKRVENQYALKDWSERLVDLLKQITDRA